MSIEILNHLQELQKPSNKQLNVKVTSSIQDKSLPHVLTEQVLIANGNWQVKPVSGISSLSQKKYRQSLRKVKTLSGQDHIIYNLNTALLGGTNYPILTAVLGTAAGLASMGAGLLFAAATTGLSVAKTTQRILARPGDEIWHVEEIGKVRSGVSYKVVYVSSFFIVDPYRNQSITNGWLIHEKREDLALT